MLLCILLGGCANDAGDPAPVSMHVSGRYVAVGGMVVSH